MKKIFTKFAFIAALFVLGSANWESFAGEQISPLRSGEGPGVRGFAKCRMVGLPEKLSVGYAVLCVDVNGGGKKDIVVVDTTRVIWFENPT